MRELRRLIDSKPAEAWEHERESLRQMETLFRALPGDVAAVAILSVVPDPNGLPDVDRKSTRLNSSHIQKSRMPSSA